MGTPVDIASNPVVTEKRHAVLGELAKSENVEGYAQERRDEEDAMFRGKDMPDERKRSWYRRAGKALADAADEAAGITKEFREQIGPNQQEKPRFIPENARPGEYYPEQQDLDYMRKMGAAAERVNQYFGQDQARRQNVMDWGQAMDPESLVSQWLIDNESVVAPQILEKLAGSPEAWKQLAELPAPQRDRWLGALEGHLTAEANFQRQMAEQVQRWDEAAGRKISRAPPPINRMPSGGALPPRDLHALARNEDISSYATMRRQQDRRSRENRRVRYDYSLDYSY